MQHKTSAPGSLMLLGEYAVLHGKHAIVAAIDKRIHVSLTPRQDTTIQIKSAGMGQFSTTLAEFKIEKPFQFVMTALKQYQCRLRTGCNIEIKSDFSPTLGLGSSAAVTVAVLAGIVSWLNIRVTALDLVRQGRNVIREVQGIGSGADIAASVYGGIVAFQPQPISVERFPVTHPLTVLYSGAKTTTIDAVHRVQNHFLAHPNLFRTLTMSIGQCALDGMQFIRKEDWQKLGEVMNIQQGLMESLGVNTPLLRTMVDDLRLQPKMMGAKISGSGLGDCVIGLGKLPRTYHFQGKNTEVKRVPLEMCLEGVQCEKS